MEDKTQVFYSPRNCHARTRMTHTAEVASLAEEIARILGLNPYLSEAIALAHDMGHVPFGHLGERFLTNLVEGKFRHNTFTVIVSELIERDGRGLGLCYETLEGVYHHSGGWEDFDIENLPQEYLIVKLADKIAYTLADYNDALRAGITGQMKVFNRLGHNQRSRVNNVEEALVKESYEKGRVSFFDSETAEIFKEARRRMFEEVYFEADKEVNQELLWSGYSYIKENERFSEHDPNLVFALSTEKEIRLFNQLFHSKIMDSEIIEKTGIVEVLPCVEGLKVEDFSSFPFDKEDFEGY